MSEEENLGRPKSAQELIAEALANKKAKRHQAEFQEHVSKVQAHEEVVDRILTVNENESKLTFLLEQIDLLEDFQKNYPDLALPGSDVDKNIIHLKEELANLPDQNVLEGASTRVTKEVVGLEEFIAQELKKVREEAMFIPRVIESFRGPHVTSFKSLDRDFPALTNLFFRIQEQLSQLEHNTLLRQKPKEILVKKITSELEKLVEKSMYEIRTMVPGFDAVSAEQQKFVADITRKANTIDFVMGGHSYENLKKLDYLNPNSVEVQPDNTGKGSGGAWVRENVTEVITYFNGEINKARLFVTELEEIKEIKGSIFGFGEKGKKKDALRKIRGKYDGLYRGILMSGSRDLESNEELRQFSDKIDEENKSDKPAWLKSTEFKSEWDLDKVSNVDQFIDGLILEQEQRIAKGEKIIDYINTFSKRIDETQGDFMKRKLVAVRFASELEKNMEKFKSERSEKTT